VNAHRSALAPPRQPLVGWLALALVGHGSALVGGIVVTVLGGHCVASKPILDLDRTMEVSMVVLPKADKALPDRAARAPVPSGEINEPRPPDQPDPVKTSDLVFEKEKAEKQRGIDRSRDRERDRLMDEMKRKNLMRDLLAPDGPVDRDATDPNSTSDEGINALGSGTATDPEFARYRAQVQQLFMRHFRPLGAIVSANPGIECTVRVMVDPTSGRVVQHTVSRASGVAAYDAAAVRAVQSVGTIPLPPAKYRGLLAGGYVVKFTPP
jgi:TonB family protein